MQSQAVVMIVQIAAHGCGCKNSSIERGIAAFRCTRHKQSLRNQGKSINPTMMATGQRRAGVCGLDQPTSGG